MILFPYQTSAISSPTSLFLFAYMWKPTVLVNPWRSILMTHNKERHFPCSNSPTILDLLFPWAIGDENQFAPSHGSLSLSLHSSSTIFIQTSQLSTQSVLLATMKWFLKGTFKHLDLSQQKFLLQLLLSSSQKKRPKSLCQGHTKMNPLTKKFCSFNRKYLHLCHHLKCPWITFKGGMNFQ